jgi:Uma2 family endonuclease
MAVQSKPMTVEEFDRFVALPENAERLFEYIGGEVVQVVSNNYSSLVAAQVLIAIGIYLKQHPIGYLTGEAGGYVVAGERYMPDVGFIAKARQPEPSRAAYNPNPPDLAVEVLSPTDSPDHVRVKVGNYLAAGTVVWVIDPERKLVEVYAPGQPVRKVGVDGVLDGGEVLPGFTLAVKDIFPE